MRSTDNKGAAGKFWWSPLFLKIFEVLLAFSLLVSASFAWFATITGNTVNNMSLTVETEDFNCEFVYFAYDVNTAEYISNTDLSDIVFNQYDLVFKSRNSYTPVLIRLGLTGESLDPDNGTITVMIDRNISQAIVDSAGKMSQTCSSVMRFTAYGGRSLYAESSAVQYDNFKPYYMTVKQLVGNSVNSVVFTTVSSAGIVTKANRIVLNYDYTSADFINSHLYVYIYITYDEGFDGTDYQGLTGIYQRTSGMTAIGGEHIKFENDLLSIEAVHSRRAD